MTTNLIEQVRGCTLCAPHLASGVNPVFQFHPKAKILIAGQAPGKKVHETGIAFNDPSGERLRQWMGVDSEVFYNPEQIAILPMGFCYPGKGKSGDLPPRPECAEQWRKRLLSQMENIQLTLIIGQYAQDWHLGKHKKDSLTSTVKAWKEYWPSHLPLPHPSPRNNIWLRKNQWFEEEIITQLQIRIRQLLSN